MKKECNDENIFSTSALTTVLIPVFKRFEFLDCAIRSVFNQTIDNWRLVIAVDTDDPSIELLRVLDTWRQDERLSVVFSPHINQCHAMNFAVRTAITSEYSTQLDSDDVLTPYALETLYGVIREQPGVGYVYTSRAPIDESGKHLKIGRKTVRPAEEFSPLRLEEDFIAQPMITWKNSEFLAAGGFDEEMPYAEDYLLALTMMLCGSRFMPIDRLCYLFRLHTAGSITSSLSQADRERFHLLARSKYLQRKIDFGISWNGEPSNVMSNWKRV